MSNEYGLRCPIALSLEILGERWTLLIVRDLFRGLRKFQDFEESLGVPPGILSRRLKLLEEHDVVVRRMYTEHPPRAEYILTKRGEELRPALLAFTIWGAKHIPGERVLVHQLCEHPVEMAYHCVHCEKNLAHTEMKGMARAARRTKKPAN